MVVIDRDLARVLRGRVAVVDGPDRVRARVDAFPAKAWQRWLLRVGFASPFLVLSMLLAGTPAADLTVNATLLSEVAGIDWQRTDAAWIAGLYPPIGTVLTRLLPGGSLGLGIVASLLAGVFLQQLLQAMQQRRFRPLQQVIFIAAVAANPLFAYTVTGNFEGFLSLAFFGLGAVDMVRFITQRNTKAGFQAGLLFMLCALSDTSGLALVAVAAVAAPLLSLARRGERGARWSNVLIVLFPTIAVFVSVMFLQLVFSGDVLSVFRQALSWDSQRLAILPYMVTTLDGALLLAPVVSGIVIAFLVRRPGASIIAVLLFAALVGGFLTGLIPANSAGNVFIVMTVMSTAIVPAAKTLRTSVAITVIAALQVAVAWSAAFTRPVTQSWMDAAWAVIGG